MRDQLLKLFNNQKESLHILFLIYIKPQINITEDPSFSTGATVYNNGAIRLRKHCFTGIKGALSLTTTEAILQSPMKDDFLKFLSIFSGRILQLRSKYVLNLLPHQKGYGGNFLKNLAGFNALPLLPIQYFIAKNKSISNLKNALTFYTKGKVKIAKYKGISIRHNNKQNYHLGSLCLGKKIPIMATNVNIYFNSYEHMINNIKNINDIYYILEYYTTNFSLSFQISTEKILLKNYYLSSKITILNK